MAKSEDVLHAASALVCVLGTATADSLAPGLGSAVGGATSLNHLRRLVGADAPDLRDRLADEIAAALADPHLRLPTDGHILIPQMIVAANPAPADLMAARMEAEALFTLLLARMTEVEHRVPGMQDAFRRVVQPILQGMLDDPGLSATLQPAFTRAAGERNRASGGCRCGLRGGAGGMDAGAGAAGLGEGADEPRQRVPDPRGTGDRDRAA